MIFHSPLAERPHSEKIANPIGRNIGSQSKKIQDSPANLFLVFALKEKLVQLTIWKKKKRLNVF